MLSLGIVSICSVAQLCPTLCNPMDCSPPDSSVHGILQARILEWVAIFSPEDSPDPEIKSGSPALQAGSLPSELQRSPDWVLLYGRKECISSFRNGFCLFIGLLFFCGFVLFI